MSHISHPFHRNRAYASRDRWGVFGALLTLTVLISAGSWLNLLKPASSAMTIEVKNIAISQTPLVANAKSTGEVSIDLVNTQTDTPASGVWVGLRIANPLDRSTKTNYYDWYSPIPERAFFATDANGNVKLPLISSKAGTIEYQIYTANPQASDAGKYQSLEKSFSVSYLKP